MWARAAGPVTTIHPLHWGGDSASTWDGMAGSLKGGLHFGLSGFAFWSHDVPGFLQLARFAMNSPVSDDICAVDGSEFLIAHSLIWDQQTGTLELSGDCFDCKRNGGNCDMH